MRLGSSLSTQKVLIIVNQIVLEFNQRNKLQLLNMEGHSEDLFYNRLVNKQEQIGIRYQAVFQLKNINTQLAIQKLVEAYPYLKQSILLSHEVLYTLGQLQHDKLHIIKDCLISVVENQGDNNLSRHQAAEALANYFIPDLSQLYTKYINSQCKQLKWTCEIALEKIKNISIKDKYGKLYHGTKEPAAPFQKEEFKQYLKQNKFVELFNEKGYLGLLLRDDIDLFSKYRIMYLMRNQKSKQCIQILCSLLSKQYYKTQTSLLKHEVCFILGQIGCEDYESLVRECIENEQQEAIVRHQALAAVASQSKDAIYLEKYINYPDILIRESARVAQFQIHYWND